MLDDGTGAETEEEANKFDGNRHQENKHRRRTDCDGNVGIRKGHTKERKSKRSRAPSPERWREELDTGEKGENVVITERYIDSDMAESDVANDGSGAEDNERVRVILTDNPRQGRTPEDRSGQALMEFDEPVHCLICKMLLNGRNQYEDHLKGKYHKRKNAHSAEAIGL